MVQAPQCRSPCSGRGGLSSPQLLMCAVRLVLSHHLLWRHDPLDTGFLSAPQTTNGWNFLSVLLERWSHCPRCTAAKANSEGSE